MEGSSLPSELASKTLPGASPTTGVPHSGGPGAPETHCADVQLTPDSSSFKKLQSDMNVSSGKATLAATVHMSGGRQPS